MGLLIIKLLARAYLKTELRTIRKSSYIDYDYVFTPQRNRKCCLELKADLQQDRKYQCSKEKIFDKETPDGFWIEKLQINKLYNVITVDNQEKSL